MKVLVIVNHSSWGSSLGVVALRLVAAMPQGGLEVAAVYFRGEGVYQALAGRVGDPGTPDLCARWLELAARNRFPLLLCRSASQRRLSQPPASDFREAGLAEVLELASRCERILSL